MSIPFKKYGYKLNPITDEIETPQIFLVNKRLKKMGELYPVENFQVTINEVNQADEISFTYYKETDGETRPLFEQIDDLTVVQVQDYGFFELAVNKQQSNSVKKSVSGISLGVAELSQITESLEINTDDDTDREDYDANYPTVFYREITIDDSEDVIKKKTESSLLHRVLKRAPHYKIGYVSPTLKYVQRTFSWSDADIVSIFNDISEEINCVFDVHVDINEDGEVERIVNVYDMQYCEYCWNQLTTAQKNTNNVHQFRNIVNGVCQNCGQSDYIRDIGDDTNIFISVDNLSDEITVDSDKDSIKNCFKISGGDDFITDTVKGLSMSGSDRIFMFSDYQKKLMSTELVEAYEKYVAECNKNKDAYTKLLETQYNLYDVIAYLQSGKMPLLEEEITSLDMALYKTIEQIQTYYEGKCYVTQWSYYNTSMMTAYNAVKNLFTTFLPKGYHMTIEEDDKVTTDEYDPKTIYKWMGKIRFYRTINSDDYYILHLEKSSTYITHGKDTNNHYHFEDAKKQTLVNNFKLSFYFGDKSQTEYMGYIKQHAAYLLSQVDLTYDNEKARHWEDYGLNPLNSYYDGFKSCIEAIDMVISEEEFEDLAIQKLKEIKSTYQKIQSDINRQIGKLEQQIFALCYYLGDFSMAQSYVDSTGAINSAYQKYISSIPTILSHMVDIKYKGGYEKDSEGNVSVDNNYIVNEYIGDKPIKCKQCGSTNVSLTTNGSVCNNCNGTDIYTYADMMQDIVDEYNNTNGQVIAESQSKYRQEFNMESYINKCDTNNLGLYNELCSFIREDVYSNSNFVSDGLTNAEVIAQTRELITKAEQELAKACIQNYTVTAPLSVIVAQKEFEYNGVVVNDDYSEFKINNYVRVKIDDDIFKVRISSIEIPFPVEDKISVTFTNATKSTGTMNAVAEAVKNATSMATSFNSVSTQAEKGQQANETFQTIKNEGLNAGLMAVKGGGEEQDVVVDNHGILLRRKIFETGEYSPYQMKLINRNIVMTDDNWNTAKMAIGYGMYEGSPYYGIWCDLLVGNLLCGNKLKIIGGKDETTGNATVVIDGNGITLDGGAITWKNPLADGSVPQAAVSGLPDTLKGLSKDIEQLDGRIQTYSQSDDPSTSWNEDEKSKHKGDIWFNPSDGLTKRWDGTKWNVVTDSNLVALAQSKGQIFTTQPTPPYNVGDLWIGNDKSDLLRCQTPKKLGEEFDVEDWIVGVKYTDDSAWKSWTSDTGEFGKYKKEIKKQVDGKSNCTYGGSTPPSNPETGDLWFCTDGSGGYGVNKAYMYNGISWKESNGVPDSVWDIADGKSSIFVVKPNKALSSVDSNFYHKNDIWILESNMTLNNKNYKAGSIMTATSDSTSFNETHWVEKVRYTDDTMAEKALSELADIGKDGVITPTEKQQIKLIINDISSTKSSIEKQCEAYNIKKEDVPLYKTYLDTYSSLISMVNTLLSDMSKTSSTPSNYDSLFTSYYTALSSMTTIIEEASKKYASDVANGIKTDLQGQIDGKIETFYQNTVPTWNASENSKHIGDLWYNTSSTDIVHSGKTYSAKTNYRFNGASWEENSIVPKDFYDAVDGKSTVYSSIPQTPQDRDLLIPGADITVNSITYKKGKVYRYNSSNSTWNEINYTDDTALQEMLTSISADDELSVAEKSYIKKQMNEIAKEYDSIKARAERYSIWSTLTSYQTAYTNLNNYISPLLSKMDEVSSITKSTFDNKFSDYYTELGVVNGLIDVAVQSAAESTASKDLNAYKQEVDEFKELVDNNLSLIGVTKVGSNYIYSPKIAGGYAYFTKGNYSVEIDPSHSAGNNTLNGYLFAIRDKSKSSNDQVIMGVDTSGNGTFSGTIKAYSGNIGGWNIDSYSLTNSDIESSSYIMTGNIGFNSTEDTGTRIGNGHILNGGKDGDFYRLAWIHNGVVDLYRQPYDTSSYRTIVTSDIIEMSKNDKIWFNANMVSNSFELYANMHISGSLLIDDNYYIYSNTTFSSGVHASIIGRSSSGNIYVGMYYYASGSHPENYTNNIFLSALNVVSLGTLKTPDGTVSASDKRLKTDICDIGSSEIDFILGLEAKKYKLKNGTSGRYHYGFIAQPVKDLMDKTIGDVGLIVKSEKLTSEDPNYVPIDFENEDTYYYGLRYEEFIAPMVKTIQMLNSEINDLKQEIKSLKEKVEKEENI